MLTDFTESYENITAIPCSSTDDFWLVHTKPSIADTFVAVLVRRSDWDTTWHRDYHLRFYPLSRCILRAADSTRDTTNPDHLLRADREAFAEITDALRIRYPDIKILEKEQASERTDKPPKVPSKQAATRALVIQAIHHGTIKGAAPPVNDVIEAVANVIPRTDAGRDNRRKWAITAYLKLLEDGRIKEEAGRLYLPVI